MDLLFDTKDQYYGALKNRIKQVMPSNIAEIRKSNNGIHQLYKSSTLEPFEFDNDIVKKVDKYMVENDELGELKRPLDMGY